VDADLSLKVTADGKQWRRGEEVGGCSCPLHLYFIPSLNCLLVRKFSSKNTKFADEKPPFHKGEIKIVSTSHILFFYRTRCYRPSADETVHQSGKWKTARAPRTPNCISNLKKAGLGHNTPGPLSTVALSQAPRIRRNQRNGEMRKQKKRF